jgi:hypothetical protein
MKTAGIKALNSATLRIRPSYAGKDFPWWGGLVSRSPSLIPMAR